uniref:Putative secreted protein n=1 Tax=Lutzomyia longipalpis TaxID=7200 RepID=A0A7G3AP77_LUTLO
MRVCFVVTLALCATLAYGVNSGEDGVIGSKKILHLSPNNPGDVYLIGNFLACINAYSCFNTAISLELETPISFLIQDIFIYEFEGCLIFFNQRTAKLIFIIPKAVMDQVLLLVNVTLDLYRLPLEAAFNSYLGINNVKLSKNCLELYSYVGNILSELLGVGGKPIAALNLLGLIDFNRAFPPELVVFQPYSVINNLPNTSPIDLALSIASTSIIVDGAAFCNKNLILQDIIFPGLTLSGYKIGNIIGKKVIVEIIPLLMGHIIGLLPPETVADLFNQIITSITIDSKADKTYQLFFELITQYSTEMIPTVPETK